MSFAFEAHDGQRRKDGRTPYIVHPLAVLRYLSSDLGIVEPDLLCAAVLHDTVEDTGTLPRALARRFGRRAARLVEELTIPPQFHGPSVPSTRKTAVVLAGARQISWGAVLVKLADRWDNLGDMPHAPWGSSQRRNYLDQTRQLICVIRERWEHDPPPRELVPALERAVQDVEARRTTQRPRSPVASRANRSAVAPESPRCPARRDPERQARSRATAPSERGAGRGS